MLRGSVVPCPEVLFDIIASRTKGRGENVYISEGIVGVEHRDKIIRVGSIHPEAISE